MADHFVASYRMAGKIGKNDANDAAALCEAAGRPHMRFVPVKTAQQRGELIVHRLREGFKEERTALINRIRGLLVGFGLSFPRRPEALRVRLGEVLEDATNELPGVARLKDKPPPVALPDDVMAAFLAPLTSAERKRRST